MEKSLRERMIENQYDCRKPVEDMTEEEIIKMIVNDKEKEKKKNEVSRNYDIVVGV